MISRNVRGPRGVSVDRRAHRRRYEESGRPAPARAGLAVAPEPLERRYLMAVNLTVETLVNTSKMRGNQTEASIAIDPTNNNRLFVASNMGSGRDPDLGPNDPIPNEAALFGATSTDGGATWAAREFANGPVLGGDNLPVACCDPSAEFDQFGNLWFAYLGAAVQPPQGFPLPEQGFHIIVLLSTDGGQTFQVVSDLGVGDQPTITTGNGNVWVTWQRNAGLRAAGAVVTGLGAHSAPPGTPADTTGVRGAFTVPQVAPDSAGGNFGDIAVGPAGEVMITYQNPVAGQLPSEIYTHIDRDGFGPGGFEPGVMVTNTNVGGFDLIPAQNRRSVDAEAGLEWDRSNGPHRGRVYLVYTDEEQFESVTGNNANLDVYVRYSDNGGTTWTERFLVNDDVGLGAVQPRAQFLPQMSLDQTTGKIAVGFHDARNDTGADRDSNDDVQYYATVGTPTDTGGLVFSPNVRVGVGQSDAKGADSLIDFGDYTGLTFHNNLVYGAWADNSNVTRDNPAGARRSFDVYTGRVRVTDVPFVPPPQVTPGSPLSPTPVREVALVRKGRFYNLNVSYTAPDGATVDPATLGDNDLTVTGPNGFSQNMLLRGFARRMRGQSVLARYRVNAPGGRWDLTDNGVYTVTLAQDAVRASNNLATPAGVLTKFLVDARPARSGRAQAVNVAAAVSAAKAADRDDEAEGATALLAQ